MHLQVISVVDVRVILWLKFTDLFLDMVFVKVEQLPQEFLSSNQTFAENCSRWAWLHVAVDKQLGSELSSEPLIHLKNLCTHHEIETMEMTAAITYIIVKTVTVVEEVE